MVNSSMDVSRAVSEVLIMAQLEDRKVEKPYWLGQ